MVDMYMTVSLAQATVASAAASAAPRGLRVLISGASGLLGTAVRAALSVPTVENRFHPEVYTLVRSRPTNDRSGWRGTVAGRVQASECVCFADTAKL